MPEDSQEAPGLHKNAVKKIEENAEKEWEEMSDDEKLEKLTDL